MTLDRLFVECSALGFQSVLTSALALTCYVLWLRQRGPHFLTWSLAWSLYVVRLDNIWLFSHQLMTCFSALLLLVAALQLAGTFKWKPWYWISVPLIFVWSWVSIYTIDSMVVAGVSTVLMLASVTIWTGIELWRDRNQVGGG